MTAEEYIKRIRTAATIEQAEAVTREAQAAVKANQITVDEWNAVWRACDKLIRPYRYEPRMRTGD